MDVTQFLWSVKMESGISNKLLVAVALVCFGMLFMLYIIIKQHQTIVTLRLKPVEIIQYSSEPVKVQECPTEEEIIEKVTTSSMLQYLIKSN